MKLSPARFDRFLGGDVRQDFAWRKSFACPCVNPASGAPRQTCAVCGGIGRLWNAEVTANCFAGMTNQTQSKMFGQFGTWSPGDALLTIPGASVLYGVRQFDRIRTLDSNEPFSVNLVRGAGDRLHGTMISLERVFWIADDQVTIVEGGLPTVNADATLTWVTGGPPAGVAYSISGVRYPEYYVYLALPSTRNIGTPGLPKKLMVRRFDLFGRT